MCIVFYISLLTTCYYLPPVFENGGRYCFGVRRRLRRLRGCFALYLGISVAIKASFLKLGMCNICKNSIAKMFLDFLKFKIVHLIEVFKIFGKRSSARGISKTAGWIFTKFALLVHLSL